MFPAAIAAQDIHKHCRPSHRAPATPPSLPPRWQACSTKPHYSPLMPAAAALLGLSRPGMLARTACARIVRSQHTECLASSHQRLRTICAQSQGDGGASAVCCGCPLCRHCCCSSALLLLPPLHLSSLMNDPPLPSSAGAPAMSNKPLSQAAAALGLQAHSVPGASGCPFAAGACASCFHHNASCISHALCAASAFLLAMLCWC